MRKGSCTTICGLQAFVFPYFLLESDFGNHPSYLEVIYAPTGCLVAQVTGMNCSFSLSKLTPWLSTLPLTLVWGLWWAADFATESTKAKCSAAAPPRPYLGLLVNAPESQGRVIHSCEIRSVSGLSSDLPHGSGHWKKGNSYWRERLIFFLRFFLKMTCQWHHLYNLLENKSHMPRNKAPQTKQPITLFQQLKGIL